MKRILPITLIASTALTMSAAITGQWTLHPSFDNSVTRIIDTPDRTWLAGYMHVYNPNVPVEADPDCSLFFLDKEDGALLPAVHNLPLSGYAVRMIEYNPERAYLAVIYDNLDIDLVFDSGEIINVAAMRLAEMPGSKAVNRINFAPDDNLMFLATDFGYVAIDDSNGTVVQSRNYSTPMNDAVKWGNYIVLLTDNATYMAPWHESRLNLADYSRPEGWQGGKAVHLINENRIVFHHTTTTDRADVIDFRAGEWKASYGLDLNNLYGYFPTKNGVCFYTWGGFQEFQKPGGGLKSLLRPESEKGQKYTASWDMKEDFSAQPRKGVRSFILAADGGKETVTRQWTLPNAPAACLSRGMTYHPDHGLLVNSFGHDAIMAANALDEPMLLSAWRNGEWKPLNPSWLHTDQRRVGANPIGLSIDPTDNRYAWCATRYQGLVRYNLSDMRDILHISHPADDTNKLPGFVAAVDTDPEWARACSFSQPGFDTKGDAWFLHYNHNQPYTELCHWSAADRKNSTVANFKKWDSFKINQIAASQTAMLLTLKAPVNANLLVYADGTNFMVYDHKGTPDDTKDDTKFISNMLTDQDGSSISTWGPGMLYEDPESGAVWYGCSTGIYYFQPRALLQGQRVFNRPKVNREDGTAYADFLLSGVPVNHMAVDGDGRRWFATNGGGIVVTASDSKTVIQEFNTANSGLPSDNIFWLCHNPENNSMMISTSKGLVEFTMGNSQAAGSKQTVRAFPNPVAPDYNGWVTIDGIPDNGTVKITDAAGNIVRELGPVQGGSVQWDIRNLRNERPNTGVYYIMSSASAEGSNESSISKILIMN